jgi:hypothetical protein
VLQKAVGELQKEIQLIDQYKNEDLQAVIEELDEERTKVRQNHQKKIRKLELELLEAKEIYLKKMVEARDRYNQLASHERKLDALKIKMGIKKNSYISGSWEALNMVSAGQASYEPLRVEQYEVSEALGYGRISSQLQKTVAEAKEKGIIE